MLRSVLLKTIKIYQTLVSPFLGIRCKFYPSCSEYGVLAIKKYGIIRGIMLSCWRVLRCNPWGRGGMDIP